MSSPNATARQAGLRCFLFTVHLAARRGEVPIIFWLLITGARVPQARAGRSSFSARQMTRLCSPELTHPPR